MVSLLTSKTVVFQIEFANVGVVSMGDHIFGKKGGEVGENKNLVIYYFGSVGKHPRGDNSVPMICHVIVY